jgi:hypothetical protein
MYLAIGGDIKTVAGDRLLHCCTLFARCHKIIRETISHATLCTPSTKPFHTPIYAHRPQNLHISSSDFLQQQIEGKPNDKKMDKVN